jgi:peptidoglycan/LPS O-acetylase OafA/YrhL
VQQNGEAEVTRASEPLKELPTEVKPSSRVIVPGIDTLRLFAACWVVFYHGAAPPLGALVPSSWRVGADLLARLPFNGNAAVVVFFVISGFCIHIGNVDKVAVAPLQFITRRVLRILPPLVAVIVICDVIGPAYRAALDVVLWSVYCEIIYYLFYPFIFPILRSDRLAGFLAGTLFVSFVMALLNPGLKFLWQFYSWTSLFCFPMWIVGCIFADRYVRGKVRIWRGNIWLIRTGVVAVAMLATLLANLPAFAIGYIWTMPVFALLSPVWIWNEIENAKEGRVSRLLERAGLAGYSIYLIHKPAMNAVAGMEYSWYLDWPLRLVSVGVASAAFYFALERPSHKLSKWAGRVLGTRQLVVTAKL